MSLLPPFRPPALPNCRRDPLMKAARMFASSVDPQHLQPLANCK
jgi:hypothetical protein